MQQVTQHEYFTKIVCPANPIITKKVQTDEETKMALKNNLSNQQSQSQLNGRKLAPKDIEQDSLQQNNTLIDRLTLMNGYSSKSLVYMKCPNSDYRTRNKKSYFASIFTNLVDWPEKNAYSVESNGIKFSSQGQSMNLFAVYQTGPNQFDLILQNDINTCGYTQWYYFSVSNKQKFQTVKFNIVNLYKSKSLYGSGMKPLINSKKLGKGWQRGGSNIIYGDNQINVQCSHRFYRTLSFQYTFLQQNNQTLFAHCYPYTYTNLKQKLKQFQKNSKIKTRFIGNTSMKKNIPIIQFSQEDINQNKKAIILMARQHPGETVGSLVMDEILSQLAKASTQNQFLLWRFNIYCIPMVNIDGVILGNYRGNAHGYDLNRCWDKQNLVKLPQIIHIKRQIKKIQKKYPIELILDLHGHSRKMGSFFYGNPFGKYTGLFAYVASNMTPSISLEDSTFHKQKSEKITTARIILGNQIKDTGCFYTYQISFYGSVINNKKVHFGIQNFQQLGRVLINSCYKTFIQIYKEQKTLKESLYLKQARKQLNVIQQSAVQNDQSGSDSQAQAITLKQMKVKIQQEEKRLPVRSLKNQNENYQKNQQQPLEKRSIQIQVGESRLDNNDQQTIEGRTSELSYNIKNQLIKNEKKMIKLGSVSEKYSLYVGFQRSEELSNMPHKIPGNDNVNRKNYLLQKLRVFGQTFVQTNMKQAHKQTQTGNFPLNIECLSKKIVCSPNQQQSLKSPQQQLRRKKNRNKSLIIRLQNKQKLTMADIVKVNRLEYKRIQRNSLIESHKRQIQQSYNKNILPNIN